MATTSSTTKSKPDNQNLARTRSLGRKPKVPSSVSSDDGSDQKPEKPLPNYLKPTISSRPDPVKFVKKNNTSLDDNQKLLRRRSFDRPPSSLTSPSTSAPRIQKSDRPAVPREKLVTTLRSSSFHGSRSGPRGGPTVKPPPVAPKKSGLSSSSTSLKSKKGGSANVTTKKLSDKDITSDSASVASAQEDEEEILKAESDLHVVDDDIEEPKDGKEDKEVQVEAVQADESVEEKETDEPTTAASLLVEDCIVVVAKEDGKREGEIISEDKTEEKIKETKDEDNNKDKMGEDEEEVTKNIDEDETPEKIDVDMKEAASVKETPEEVKEEKETKKEKKEKVKEEEEVKEDEKENEKVKEEEEVKVDEKEKEKVKEEEEVKEDEKEKDKVKEEEKVKEQDSKEVKKREVVTGKKESPSAYNDVIASKMQGNPRKNKVLALAGAFQTVIDYETAASK